VTPAELAVERDWLLEHGRSVEEVEAMQRADELLAALRRLFAQHAELFETMETEGYRLREFACDGCTGGRGNVDDYLCPRHEALSVLAKLGGASTPVQREGR